ncbi:MAG: winged helix-turn-helix transcriptional regulator [Actinobacteria bacterium]|nr:MAG: winged helix-turn-helix transcriptional regulator [Actinomycetota bacterium]
MTDDRPVDRIFAALADPTRRAVIRKLSEGPATVGGLAEDLPVTRQAVAKHLAQLEDAGLVDSTADGRRRTYRLTPGPLAKAMDWMVDVGGEWDERLRALKRVVERGR